ncbi:hypothetical protein E7Z59_06925 [Robertkochia marina]|uniref:Uncharacterized protein n=1 Tax=Robertkochia marina TaxID=1227945 RepID=A0A4S3M1H1_9FLAO|nr:carcinine hydrolase/isopenicillin-N N-acyltransferase family protein [Robertkochia marina]THD67389.1 hypothetical protein E7Z59_06925 [Robertkochia marina]TRZ43043.1 hypothetical protein D3A96_11230 [Robertkochia marina]
MCDTFTFFSKIEKDESFFAKNSDRDPGEPQIIEITDEVKPHFDNTFFTESLPKYTPQLEALKRLIPKYDHPYKAILSRPTWIWGAEMGVNEKGVCIGNEAVFSKEPLIPDGILGMDILRLALHNGATATEAAEIITSVLESCGQGGNGSYSGSLKYHNSFLIKDFHRAYVIESSGKNWVRKEVKECASISNSYTLRKDYNLASHAFRGTDLKKDLENSFYTFFSKGDFRQDYTHQQIKYLDKGVNEVFGILRSHISADNKMKRGMRSICVHPGIIVKSETTSSMIVHYYKDKIITWVTSSPNPCVSLFKPLVLSNNNAFHQFRSPERALAYFKTNRSVAEFLVRNKVIFNKEVKSLRDELQAQFLDIIYSDLENKTTEQLVADCSRCFEMEQTYLQQIHTLTGQSIVTP